MIWVMTSWLNQSCQEESLSTANQLAEALSPKKAELKFEEVKFNYIQNPVFAACEKKEAVWKI